MMRPFALEVFFSKWEFTAKHHMTASDAESMGLSELLSLASDEDRAAFETLWLGYTETWGAPTLREQIAQTYEALEAKHILCFAGAGEGIYVMMKCLLTAEDHMIVPVPNYQSAETVPLDICEVSAVPMTYQAAGNEAGWHLDIQQIKDAIRPNTKAISVNFPHNPTGYIPTRDEIHELVTLCRHHGLTLFSDEVYRGIELDETDRIPQLADIYEKAVSLNVMSKSYGLPGLRIGWTASQDIPLLQKAEKYKHYLSICNAGPSELLSLIALRARDQILSRNRAILRRNITTLESLFAEFPGLIEWQRPKGGCVAYPRFAGSEGGEVFCQKLIEEAGVLLLPASLYASDIAPATPDHFRIGFGRETGFAAGIEAMRQHFRRHYGRFAA